MTPAVSVCVPVHKPHGPPNLAALAEALPEAVDGLDAELVVVLNGISAADAGAPADAVLVRFEENQGVSKGWNAAARAASAPVLCIVNDDVVPGPGSVRLLHGAVADADEVGVVGPEGSRWRVSGGEHLGYVPTEDLAPGELREADALSGFLFCVRREVWERAGGFDESYTPAGYEEIDFCTTVRLKLGLRNRVVGGIEYQHDFGISLHKPWSRVRHNGRTEFLRTVMRRNRRYFLDKWSGADA